MHYWFNGGHMVWMAIWWLFAIGFFSLVIWLLIAAVSSGPESSRSPEEILRRRYAAGEIQSEEYESRLEELRKTKNAA
jgi:putative membrane protein